MLLFFINIPTHMQIYIKRQSFMSMHREIVVIQLIVPTSLAMLRPPQLLLPSPTLWRYRVLHLIPDREFKFDPGRFLCVIPTQLFKISGQGFKRVTSPRVKFIILFVL